MGTNMQKICEYQDHAVECRHMVTKTSNSSYKEQLENIARAWEMLADMRKKQMERGLTRGPLLSLHSTPRG